MKITNCQKQQRIAIKVETLPNGYAVDLEKEGFMYFNVEDLLEGLFVHVGMNREGAMAKREIKVLIESIKSGSIVTTLQAEMNELRATIDEQKKLIREQKKVIKQLSKEV